MTTSTDTHTTVTDWNCRFCDYTARLIDTSGGAGKFYRSENSQGCYNGFQSATPEQARADFQRVFVETHKCAERSHRYWNSIAFG